MNLFVTNTAFKHPPKHRFTWSQKRVVDNIVKTYKSQIDFILCNSSSKPFLQNARSYGGTLTTSDHKLVICKLSIIWDKIWKKPATRKPKFAVNKIHNNQEEKEKYQRALDVNLSANTSNDQTLQEHWNAIKKSIKDAAEQTVGLQEKIKHRNRTPAAEIMALSAEQKNLRLQIERSSDENKI